MEYIKELKPEYTKRIEQFKSADYYGMYKIYENLYMKSTNNINVKNIMPIIKSKENMLTAIRNIKSNSGADTVGVDGITFTKLLETYNTDELLNKVRNLIDNYETTGVRRIYIPKKNGKMRPLGIPNAIDKLIQQMVKQIIEPYCEGKFFRHSYGFRPTRKISEVIARCHHLVANGRLNYCVDMDIKGFFDNVNHNKLIKQIWNLGIKDKSVLMLIKKMLKAPVDGIIQTKGTPQGGVLSPLLSNIVLHDVDMWVSKQWEDFQTHTNSTKDPGEFTKELRYKKKIIKDNKETKVWKTLKMGYIVRYADDFKIFAPNYNEACRWYHATKKYLEKRLNLEVSEEKSKIINLTKATSEFLGFTMKSVNTNKKFPKTRPNVKVRGTKTRHVLQIRLQKTKQDEIVQKFKYLLSQLPGKEEKYMKLLNTTILGWQNYISNGTYPSDDLARIYRRVNGKLRRMVSLHGKLKWTKIQEQLHTSEVFKERYKTYNGKTLVNPQTKIPLFPLWATKQVRTKMRNPNHTPYKRKDLIKFWYKPLQWSNQKGREIIENYTNNIWVNSLVSIHALSLYTAQYGCCPLTELALTDGFEIHHKKSQKLGGNNSYRNLIMINPNIHKILHSTNPEIIDKYINVITNLGGKLNYNYINRLRKYLNLEEIKKV